MELSYVIITCSNEQTENTALRGGAGGVGERGNCFWQVLESIFQPKSCELIQNADTAPLFHVDCHHQGQEKILKEQSQSHFFDCQNECKELLHLETQTNVKRGADLPASEPFLHAAEPPQTWGLCVSCPPAIMSRAHFTPYLPKQKHKPTSPPTHQPIKKRKGEHVRPGRSRNSNTHRTHRHHWALCVHTSTKCVCGHGVTSDVHSTYKLGRYSKVKEWFVMSQPWSNDHTRPLHSQSMWVPLGQLSTWLNLMTLLLPFQIEVTSKVSFFSMQFEVCIEQSLNLTF